MQTTVWCDNNLWFLLRTSSILIACNLFIAIILHRSSRTNQKYHTASG
ncbi:hypothetical protein DICVIV_13255 [Dictyocaulus viviparus]|uniref:Uncharacterized protein n=1 Tax=Dictyocaulus viviparus TaxID=29172 RepID=A0A0D8XAW7_DICVI|nr:hypothetical protein DICVIV_13255 [Dictyocaulus viviparus]